MQQKVKKEDILKFWRDIEIFDLPDLNKEAALIITDDPLPWLSDNRPIPKKYFKWRYTLIFGKVSKSVVLNHLNTLLHADVTNDWEEPVQGFTCFSALILDEDGCPETDNYVVASYIFGIKALESKKALSEVSQDLNKVREDFAERYNIVQTDFKENRDLSSKGDVVHWTHLEQEAAYLNELTGWSKEKVEVFLLVEEVPKDSEPNPGFMNSFFLDDLNYVSSIEEKKLSTTIKDYLQLQPSIMERKDLITNKQLLFDAINPDYMTAGRWPSKIAFGLYAAQVGAVNTIFSNLRYNNGLQGVNGPPGTGKTTLLLDVIAEVIVERAKIISKLGCNGIFTGAHTKIDKESGYSLHTYNLDPLLLKNFGIVVASNNNAAVENISKELPLKSKIDQENFPNAEYFSECSGKLINEESWGVLAASLGNAKNRNSFKKSFWRVEKQKGIIGFHDLLYEVYKDKQNDKTHTHFESFELQNEKFKFLLKEFEVFRNAAGSFHKQLPIFIKNKEQEKSCKAELLNNEKKLYLLNREKQSLQERELNVKREIESTQSVLHLHTQRKPSFFFFQKLFNTKSFQKWDEEAGTILSKIKSAISESETLKLQLNKNHGDIQSLASKQTDLKTKLAQLFSFFAGYEGLQSELSEKYEIDTKNLFNTTFYEKDIEDVHLLNPYHSPKVAKLRSELFIAALQLHRDVILANAKNIRNNLNTYFEMISGWAKVDPIIAQNLWDTFFLCVPVVSTTLASASRLFPNLDQEQIGWLLIDEAGQATPQSAVGIIHRAKRCVIVGDPLQVEPVVTMPEKMVAKLRNEHNVPVDWSPYRVSVQQLADRVSISGTYMHIGNTDEKIWTGFPLRTHRRCDDPMFSIANKIAYSGQMVKAINTNSTESFIGNSSWFNVSSEHTTLVNKHVVKDEIIFLAQRIEELRSSGYQGEIYVISPFKSIAAYCEDAFRGDKRVSCGTIHRFQGKEADIVFLVLGSDPKSQGARNWASQKPNMLNVALTRAKKRFYVIGNKRLWSSCNYFNTMEKLLK
jgi:hypothetical protein